MVYTVNLVYTVDRVYAVDTVCTVYTIQIALGMDGAKKSDEFLEKIQTALTPRVFLKMKNPFLWAGLRNPIVSIYKEPKYQFSNFLDTYWPLPP